MRFFDLHCDTPYESYKTGEPFYNGRLAVNMCRGAVFSKWCQVCALWIPDECRGAKERYGEMLENFKKQLPKVTDTAEGLDSDNVFLLSLEGGAVIDDTADVDALYRDGVRIITLTWNGKNRLAGGANTNEPLTKLGSYVIARMNELSMAVDLSHLNDRAFFEVCEQAKYVLATHSCSRAVHHVRRNLTDEQIIKIKEKNGIIGLCLYPRFLGEENVFSDFNAHLTHIVQIAGEDTVAIGSDFDGAEMDERLDSLDKIPLLYSYLRGVGWSETALDKLFYSNAYNFFKGLLK